MTYVIYEARAETPWAQETLVPRKLEWPLTSAWNMIRVPTVLANEVTRSATSTIVG